ncbi:MAG: glycosyltransferase family 39 protein [Phycisphaeraceae bacterium]|nr:glycosyltransferase family 39 protein [Phycisphaeraceae bacterium]
MKWHHPNDVVEVDAPAYSDPEAPVLSRAKSIVPDAVRSLSIPLFLTLCIGMIWFSLGDHPLKSPSEARYAVVSMNMASGSGWLVPVYENHPHLTKPPLTYWLEAACIRAFGVNELAVRLPSALAGSLTLLLVFGFARRLRGNRFACLATGVMALMPMHLALARLTLTDALLGLFWWMTLMFGFLAVREPADKRWPVFAWLGVALGLLTKGPVAWVPLALLLIWLGLAGRWRDMRALRIPLGFTLSLIPLVLWAGLVWHLDPAAIQIWQHEMVDRARGRGDHNEPIYYFIPILAGGLFPATMLMNLPGINFPWSRAREMARRAEPSVLWVLSVIVPFVMFSLIRGKLPSYLLPLCPPMALLAAGTLQRWLEREDETPHPNIRLPWVVEPFTVIAAIGFLVGIIIMSWRFGPLFALLLWPLGCVVAVGIWAWRNARRRPQTRAPAMIAIFIVLACCWMWGFEIEDSITASHEYDRLVTSLENHLGQSRPLELAFVQTRDASLEFYNRASVPRLTTDEFPAWLAAHPHGVVITTASGWETQMQKWPQAAQKVEPLLLWKRQPLLEDWVVLSGK